MRPLCLIFALLTPIFGFADQSEKPTWKLDDRSQTREEFITSHVEYLMPDQTTLQAIQNKNLCTASISNEHYTPWVGSTDHGTNIFIQCDNDPEALHNNTHAKEVDLNGDYDFTNRVIRRLTTELAQVGFKEPLCKASSDSVLRVCVFSKTGFAEALRAQQILKDVK
jgi:hypothetical protein